MIIGITGTIGSGKGTVVDYLVEKYGFNHYSARDFIAQEIMHRGWPVNRDTTIMVGNDLRAKYGPGHIAEELYKRAAATGGNAVIESIRALGEIEALKNKGQFRLWAVDADPHARYARISARQSALDKVSFEEFLAHENQEMNSDDPSRQNLSGCIARADVKFTNNGTLDELKKQVDAAMTEINPPKKS